MGLWSQEEAGSDARLTVCNNTTQITKEQWHCMKTVPKLRQKFGSSSPAVVCCATFSSEMSDSGEQEGAGLEPMLLSYPLPHASARTWAYIESCLCDAPSSWDGLRDVLDQFQSYFQGAISPSTNAFHCLKEVVAEIFENDADYFAFVSWLCHTALQLQPLFPTGQLPLLTANNACQLSLSRAQSVCLLAHGFFGTLPHLHLLDAAAEEHNIHVGQLRLVMLVHGSGDSVASARLKGYMLYLKLVYMQRLDMQHMVTAVRAVDHAPRAFAEWEQDRAKLAAASIHSGLMEVDGPAAMVDFANKDLMIGEIIASATQEEVLFTNRPDLFPFLLLCERMQPHEAILFYGAEHLVTSTGYLDTFSVTGTVAPCPPPSAIIAIDAIVNYGNAELSTVLMARDLNKAHIGFASYAQSARSPAHSPGAAPTPVVPVVSSGKWGCGIFRGTPLLKFLQQLMVASSVGCGLQFSCYHDAALQAVCERVQAALLAADATVGRLAVLLRLFRESGAPVSGLEAFLLSRLLPS